MATWIKIKAELAPGDKRSDVRIINLDGAIGFEYMSEAGYPDKIGPGINILFHERVLRVSQKTQSQVYQQILEYIKTTTGHSLP